MSAELLLLLIVVILWPLIQQLLGSLGQQPTADHRTEQPPRGSEPGPRPAAGTLFERGPTDTRLPEMARRHLTDAAAKESTPPLKPAGSAMPALPIHPGSRRHLAVAGLRNSAGLRRSIVLMTILGPCRAIDPYPNRNEPR